LRALEQRHGGTPRADTAPAMVNAIRARDDLTDEQRTFCY
jgi:hypothetical protein